MNAPWRLLAAAIVGAGIAASGYMVGKGLTGFRGDNRTITVKGLAEIGGGMLRLGCWSKVHKANSTIVVY